MADGSRSEEVSGIGLTVVSLFNLCEGTSGFVAINNADVPWGVTLPTSLPPGRYCDVTSGRVVGKQCNGVTYVDKLPQEFIQNKHSSN